MNVHRLGPGDEGIVERLATFARPARADELLADDRTLFLVALEADEPIGFVLAYELLRRHGDPSHVFVYEIDVDPPHRRRGVATALLNHLSELAQARGIRSGFVLTNASNEAAMALYRSLGAGRPHTDDVLWDFTYEAS